MINRIKPLFILVAVLFWGHTVNAQPSILVRSSAYPPQQTAQPSLNENNSTESRNNNAQAQIEEAAEQFDSFALLMPKVLNAKLQSFFKHGFKAILLEDPETKPAEEQMIGALIKGLQAMGDSLSEDLANNHLHQALNPVQKKPNRQQE